MSTTYLLPCDCGQPVPITPSQAGSQVTCECGAQLDVPTLRGIRELPVAEPEQQKGQQQAAATWSARQGAILLGLIVLLLGAVPTIYLFVRFPERPALTDEREQAVIELQDQRIEDMPLSQTWRLWKFEIEGPGLRKYELPSQIAYERNAAALARKLYIAAAVAIIGLLILVGGFFLPSRSR